VSRSANFMIRKFPGRRIQRVMLSKSRSNMHLRRRPQPSGSMVQQIDGIFMLKCITTRQTTGDIAAVALSRLAKSKTGSSP